MQLALGSLVSYEYGQSQGVYVLTVGHDPVTHRGGPGWVLGIDDHDQGEGVSLEVGTGPRYASYRAGGAQRSIALRFMAMSISMYSFVVVMLTCFICGDPGAVTCSRDAACCLAEKESPVGVHAMPGPLDGGRHPGDQARASAAG